MKYRDILNAYIWEMREYILAGILMGAAVSPLSTQPDVYLITRFLLLGWTIYTILLYSKRVGCKI